MTQSAAARVLWALFSLSAAACTAGAGERPATRPVVVIELFTSEGCSSCPPADALLTDLSAPEAVEGVQIVPLGLHVDYWNQLGWTDPFSSAQFSRRQQEYADAMHSEQIYTPQMIVDGSEGFVGSDRRKALAAIAESARQPKGSVSLELTPIRKDDNVTVCKFSISSVPDRKNEVVMLAVTEDALTSAVRRGENAGRKLKHAAVVRLLQEVAAPKPGDPAEYAGQATIHLQPAWDLDHLHVAVWVQNNTTRKIEAAGEIQVTRVPVK